MARLEDILRPIGTHPLRWLRSQGAFWPPSEKYCDAAHASLGHNAGHLTQRSFCEDRCIPEGCSSKLADTAICDCLRTGSRKVAS